MKTTELTDLQQMIALWKEKGITECSMEFNCGGDQMNDYTFTFYTKEGQVECEELDSYFDGEVYNNVEFYVNSDGHYMGESGYVYITLEDDEESFNYRKDAESEWNETFSEVAYFPLTEDYKKFIQDKVQSIVGGEDGEAINYKGDCILTDEEEAIASSLQSDLHDFACDVEISEAEGEAGEWFRFSTNNPEDDDIDDDSLGVTITDDGLKVSVEKTYYIYRPSED